MDKIFISYRREDSEGFARSLYQSLTSRFGEDQVFMDVEAIGLGMDFVEAIDSSLADCGALLVLIGKNWIDCSDAEGRRRLEKDDDFVRTEVAKAIERNVRVIPVMVKGAKMPKPGQLPKELRSLARRQALEIRHERWDHDVDHLATSLEKALGLKRIDQARPADTPARAPSAPARQRRSKAWMFVGAAVVAVFIGGFVFTQGTDRSATAVTEAVVSRTPEPAPAPAKKPAPAPAPASEQAARQAPAPTARPGRVASLTGIWIDDDGARVEFVQTGTTAMSQAIDPATGALIKANWRLNGRNFDFTWVAASGNQGYGKGTISEDYNVMHYEAVDYLTGLQDTGRLVRSTR